MGGKAGQCIELTTFPHLYANCLEIWEIQTLGNLWVSNRPAQGLLYLYRIVLLNT
jgi:hypothetical protein